MCFCAVLPYTIWGATGQTGLQNGNNVVDACAPVRRSQVVNVCPQPLAQPSDGAASGSCLAPAAGGPSGANPSVPVSITGAHCRPPQHAPTSLLSLTSTLP